MSRWLVMLAFTLVACGGRSEPAVQGPFRTVEPPWPADDVGNGMDGALVVSDSWMYAAVCYGLQRVEDGRPIVDGWGGTPERRLLLLQTQDAYGVLDDTAAVTDPETMGDAGMWQIVRVHEANAGAAGGIILTTEPQAVGFSTDPAAGRSAQACEMLEYTDVAFEAGTTTEVPRWDGSTGGVLAFFASGTVRLDGTISTVGHAFRGGLVLGAGDTKPARADAIDVDPSTLAAGSRGEGMDGRAFGGAGVGNLGNAGGGALYDQGGGGGAGAGSGGLGGDFNILNSGGYGQASGGAGVRLGNLDRLVLGGGGGAGHWNASSTATAGAGGDGGGVVIVIAARLEGTGAVLAHGGAGGNASSEGAGGGGGGGTIWVQASGDFQGVLDASGGRGGNTGTAHGPGGGGGGGLIFVGGLPLTATEVYFDGASAGSSASFQRETDGEAGLLLGSPSE